MDLISWINWYHYNQIADLAMEHLLPWTADTIRESLREKGVTGVVHLDRPGGSVVLGAMVYRLHYACMEIMLLTAGLQCQGIDAALVKRLQRKCTLNYTDKKAEIADSPRQSIICDVPAELAETHEFLSSMGFIARRPTRYDRECGTYRFAWVAAPDVIPPEPENLQQQPDPPAEWEPVGD